MTSVGRKIHDTTIAAYIALSETVPKPSLAFIDDWRLADREKIAYKIKPRIHIQNP